MLSEQERRVRLNEIGKEVAEMFPTSNGSVVFNYKQGKLMGVKSDDMWRPLGVRPSPLRDGGY